MNHAGSEVSKSRKGSAATKPQRTDAARDPQNEKTRRENFTGRILIGAERTWNNESHESSRMSFGNEKVFECRGVMDVMDLVDEMDLVEDVEAQAARSKTAPTPR